jgi:hypothetical protein
MRNKFMPLVKTLRYRVKDRASGRHLDSAARAVNLVWNHCNGAQRHALKHNTNWPTTGQLQRLTAGAARFIGVPAQTVQAVCEEYINRRRGSRKAKLRWRGKRCLGWVPFKNQTVRVRGSIIHVNGRKVRLWLHPTASQSEAQKVPQASKLESGPAAAATWFMTATWPPHATFSAWDVRRLQKEAPPSAPER